MEGKEGKGEGENDGGGLEGVRRRVCRGCLKVIEGVEWEGEEM